MVLTTGVEEIVGVKLYVSFEGTFGMKEGVRVGSYERVTSNP